MRPLLFLLQKMQGYPPSGGPGAQYPGAPLPLPASYPQHAGIYPPTCGYPLTAYTAAAPATINVTTPPPRPAYSLEGVPYPPAHGQMGYVLPQPPLVPCCMYPTFSKRFPT